jgi:osmotically-inducible protein OsmY
MDIEYQYLVGHLQDALAADARVNALDIKVVVAGGRIHLTGQVPTEERRTAVSRIVSELQPTLPVHNELTVLELSEAVKHEGLHA